MNEQWLMKHAHSLLEFAQGSMCEEGGFGWLDDFGRIDTSQGRPLWITCRMTHVAAIGALLGHPGCRAAVDHGVAALTGCFRDQDNGGWYAQLNWDNTPTDTEKAAYPHAFVILASSSAVTALSALGMDTSDALAVLKDALNVSSAHFWDEEYSMVVEQWDRGFTALDPYRGVNANMHTVEAYLAAADALDLLDPQPTGFPVTATTLRNRALAITDRVLNREARGNNWRIPEHYDTSWHSILDYNQDRPADPFRPYGATIGHGLEWARLCLQVWANIPDRPAWMPEAALALYDRSLNDGWAVDGHDGFVYTTDWDGAPVVRERMHWVVAEAIGASAAIEKAGLRDTASDTSRWWAYAQRYLIDQTHGSWHHELDPNNNPSSTVWQGKPDVYHALQATLFARLPLTPSIVEALAGLADDQGGGDDLGGEVPRIGAGVNDFEQHTAGSQR